MKVELSKQECEFLSREMMGAIQLADTAQASEEAAEAKAMFVSIKTKLDIAQNLCPNAPPPPTTRMNAGQRFV